MDGLGRGSADARELRKAAEATRSVLVCNMVAILLHADSRLLEDGPNWDVLILTSSPYIALYAPLPRFRLIATPNRLSDTASQMR